MRARRHIYVELNRHVDIYVYVHGSDTELDEENFYSDYFVLSVPEYNSEFDVWLVKNLNKQDSLWQRISDESLDAMELENTLNEDQIMARIDNYQRTQYDEEDIDEDVSEYDREYFDLEETDYVDEEEMDISDEREE